MGTFEFGRIEGFPAQYSSEKSPVTLDVTETIFILLFVIIGIAYLCIAPGYSKKRSIHVAVKAILSLVIGCLIIVENFGQEWEVGAVKTRVPYRAGIKNQIDSSIGLKIGLRSINITLQAEGKQGTPLEKEIINYNERFWWTWDQGRFGFGPYAGLLQRSYRAAQRRGLPIPILWVAEYFTIDGEGIRFGRFYRTAGWYCHILLWTAFASWILANIFLQTVGRYAAYWLAAAGGLQLLSCIVWLSVHNPTPLVIPFEDGTIIVKLGLHFWMTFTCGTLSIILALIMIFLDLRYPNALSTFLGIDPLDQYDEYVIRYSELEGMMRKKKNVSDEMQMTTVSGNSQLSRDESVIVLRRKSTIKNVQKALFRSPAPVKIVSDEEAIYQNQDIAGPSGVDTQQSKDGRGDYKPPVPKKVKRIKVVL